MHKQAKNHVAKYIPEQVLVEILKRVPPKSLIRFTCVCKLWHSIIVSSRFIDAHLEMTLKAGTNRLYLVRKSIQGVPNFSLCCDDASLSEITSLPHQLRYYGEKNLEILGTINGLVCLLYVSADLNGTKYADYMLWNPLVHKVRHLARTMLADFRFDSRVSGFGYDSINDDYKVIRIDYRSDKPSAYLFPRYLSQYFGFQDRLFQPLSSLRRGSWRALYPEPLRVATLRRVNFKGNVHWLSRRESGVFAVFDMVAEEFKKFMLPNGVHGFLNLEVYRDSLSVVDHRGVENCLVDLWVMKEYGVQESWSKQFSVHISGPVAKFAGFTYSGELLMVEDGRLISHNVETKDSTVSEHEGISYCKVLPYVGSLILADIGSACPLSFGTQEQREEGKLNNVVT